MPMPPKARRACLWFVAAVVIGLLPILFNVVHTADAGGKQHWHEILATGDALVLSAALAGGCIYDLLIKRVREDKEDTKNVLILATFVAAFGAALWYADIRSTANGGNIDVWTLAYLGGTVLICLRALYLTYDSEHRIPRSDVKETVAPQPEPEPEPREQEHAGQSVTPDKGGGISA
jgi:drug/metabolite transporter (DMT)-like permease